MAQWATKGIIKLSLKKKKQHSLGAFFGNLLVIGALNAFDVFDLIQVWGIRSAQGGNDDIPFVNILQYIYIYIHYI